jgi:outer membrane cobalamin receptor
VQMVGTRTADLSGSRTLEPFVLLDVSAQYSFLPGWWVQGEIRNLLGTRYEWWEGYVSLPRTASLGIAYNW